MNAVKDETKAEGADPFVTAAGAVSGAQTDVPATKDGRKALVVTTLICALFAGGGHLALLIAWNMGDEEVFPLPWQPIVGVSLAVVSIVAFGGMFLASLRARVAIASAFILTFLLMLTYVVTISQMGEWDSESLAQALMDDFRVILQTIIGFYFGTEALISVAKIVKTPSGLGAKAVMRADRDLPSGS